MKPHERHADSSYPYFKLASWSERSQTFVDGKRAFASATAARQSAECPGKYRISEVTAAGRRDYAPFYVG